MKLAMALLLGSRAFVLVAGGTLLMMLLALAASLAFRL